MDVCRAGSGPAAWPRRDRGCDLAGIILGSSAAIVSLREEIAGLAAAGVRSLLITGETGTGKDLVPAALLACSPQLHGRLEVFNCPAIPADHLESELFGTTRGAYPGAVEREGAAERAAGGLLMLDEIASMPLAHQAKLLRLLESGEGRRLGASRGYRLDVSFAAATNVDLVQAVERGEFRQDLYYRLVQDAVLRVPPLRERREDIGLLAAHFLRALPGAPAVSEAALSRLREHSWPGNLRELRAVVRAAVRIGAGARLGAAEIETALRRISGPRACGREPAAASFQGATDGVRRQLLVEALSAAAGNRTRAGILLGLHCRRGQGARGDPGFQGLDGAARKRAHRKFEYWHRLLVADPDSY